MRPDQLRVQTLLTDTVTLLCKNGLQYSKELKVQGLLGITLDDDDVFVVHINKIFDDVRGKVTALSVEPIEHNAEDYENMDRTDGYEAYEDMKKEEDTSLNQYTGMQLPLFHSAQTSITQPSVGVAKKQTTNARKRPIGAAKRKEKRSVKQRLASSFSEDYSEYQGIRVSDEPPDELIINPEDGEICISEVQGSVNGDIHTSSYSTTSRDSFHAQKTEANSAVYENYSTGSRDSFPGQKAEQNPYENLADCDSNNQEDDQMDMIECLLYNEGKQSDAGIYKNVHISGGEDSPQEAQDEDVVEDDKEWDESQEMTPDSFSVQCKQEVVDSKSTNNNLANASSANPASASFKPANHTRVHRHGRGTGMPLSCRKCRTRKRRPVVSAEKRFVCPYPECGLLYYRRDNMIRHHLMKHGIKLSVSYIENQEGSSTLD